MGTSGSYNSTQPLKHLKMSHHDIWLTTTSGKKSEAKEVAAKKERLAKLVSFNTNDETEVKIVGTKNKKPPVQAQMTMMKTLHITPKSVPNTFVNRKHVRHSPPRPPARRPVTNPTKPTETERHPL